MQQHQRHSNRNIILLYAALFLFLLLVGCTAKEDQFKACCSECLTAFSKSPAGVGPAGAICGSFLTAAAYSEECTAYFEGKHIAVAMCQ